MKPRLSLKKRIALTYVLLAVVVAGAFCLVSYISVEVIEEQVIDARLAKMADRLIEFHQKGHMPDAPPEVRFMIDDAIPADLRQLPAGVHEVGLGNRHVHALLRDHGTSRYAVVQEVDELEYTELVILLSLAMGFAVSVLLAAVLGVLSARRVIAPVAGWSLKTPARVFPRRCANDCLNDLSTVMTDQHAKVWALACRS